MTISKPIHPFPARMAPEILVNILRDLPQESTVLDPMTGSGTVIHTALKYNHYPIGLDKDPLAILLSKVWTRPIDIKSLEEAKNDVYKNAKKSDHLFDDIIKDSKTKTFIDFWFAKEQRNDLAKLSYHILERDDDNRDILKVALSRLIITKDKGASLARDVSHSRPHKVSDTNSFNVIEEFKKSVEFISKRLASNPFTYSAFVRSGDSRHLLELESSVIDSVITSPPYLNAVDYMRGHKLSLVWLGYTIEELTNIRSNSIGAERKPDSYDKKQIIEQAIQSIGEIDKLDNRLQSMIHRYALDIYAMIGESYRVLKNGGNATFVIGNSCLKNIFIKNTEILKNAAQMHGFRLVTENERQIPPNKRYLPPPISNSNGIQNRMRTESIITLCKM